MDERRVSTHGFRGVKGDPGRSVVESSEEVPEGPVDRTVPPTIYEGPVTGPGSGVQGEEVTEDALSLR